MSTMLPWDGRSTRWCRNNFQANEAQSLPCITWSPDSFCTRLCISNALPTEQLCLAPVYIPTNVYDAWCYVQGTSNADETAMQGVTKLDNAAAGEYLRALPQTLESLAFRWNFNQTLEQVTLPKGLQSLTFGARFNHSLEQVTLPKGLQSLRFGEGFNQSLDRIE